MIVLCAPLRTRDNSAKVLEIGGIEEPTKRYKVVVPENYHRFPSHFSLTTCLLYSPRALRRITNFCRGKRGTPLAFNLQLMHLYI